MANIELQQVEKRFGESYAVQPMDLHIQDGEFIALLGPSGCGKTTTLRMICGLETVSEGKITLNGADVTRLPPSQRDIALVFQFFALYPHLSVRENIAFPLKAQGGRGASVDEQVNEVARMIQIEHMLRLKPGALSSGDQQRVALARALGAQARLLFDGRAVGRAGCRLPRDDARGNQEAACWPSTPRRSM